MMGYDNVIRHMGNFGRYQRRIFLVLLLPAIACAFHKMGGVFLAARADFRCLLPHESPENATYQLSPNITSLKYLWNEESKTWPQCEKYNPGIVDPHQATDEHIPSTFSTVKCDSFVYDRTYYTQTATTEWDLVCNDAWLKSLSESLFLLGELPGVVIFGGLSDRYGRRTALLWDSIVQLIVALLVSLSPNFSSYTVLRVLVGSTASSLFLIVYVTAVEMVGPQNRTTAGVILNLAYAAGYILSAVLAYVIRQWRYLQIVFTIPTIVLLVFWWFIPESARWLLTKGRVQEAKDIVQKISSGNGIELSPENLDTWLSKDSEIAKPVIVKSSAFDLLRYPNLRRKSLLLFFIWFVIHATYFGLSWNTSNLGGNDYINFGIAAAVEVPAYLSLLFTSDRWGRKIPLCGGMVLSGLSLLLSFCIPTGMTWLVILCAMIGKLAITISFAAVYVFTAEQYPTTIRNLGVAYCLGFAKLGGALAPYINILSELSTFLPLLVFGSSSLVAGLSSLLLPETLNTNLPETIQDAEQLGKSTTTAKRDLERCNDVGGT